MLSVRMRLKDGGVAPLWEERRGWVERSWERRVVGRGCSVDI